jgi:hypothetical protein
MSERKLGRLGNFKIIDIEGGNPQGVKNSWFEAYLASNMTMPQTSVYIDIFTARAVLQDPPQNWTDFAISEFSDAQRKKLGTIMSQVHARKDVKFSTPDHVPLFRSETPPNIVLENRLKTLWSTTRQMIIYKVLRAMKDFSPPGMAEFSNHPENLDNFLKDPKNSYLVGKLSEKLDLIEKAFRSKIVQECLAVYRVKVTQGPKSQIDALQQGLNDFRSLMLKELETMGVDLQDPFMENVLVAFSIKSAKAE